MGDSRITSTSTGQYDMLLAMSQDSVNAAIANMWDVEGDELATIEYEGGPAGSLKGTLTGVDIQVLADGPSQGSVYFRMTFGEGEAKFWDKKAKKTLPFPMKGWKLAMKVNIGKLHRSALNDLHAQLLQLQTKLSDSNLSPPDKKTLGDQKLAVEEEIGRFDRAADYSIQRLFVDFASAELSSINPVENVLTGLNLQQQNDFLYLMTNWLTENKTEGNTTLGYALNVSDESKKKDIKVANCLIPTSVSLQTYPFKAHPTADPKLGWSGDAARNCIVYADMTENRKVSGDKMLRWSGNFTTLQFDKEGLVDGSMCIRRDLFLGRFIVPMLRQYNDDMQIIAKTMEIRRDGGAGDRKFHWTYRSDLGYNEDHPDWKSSYFDFRENAQGASLKSIKDRPKYSEALQQGFDAVESAQGVSWSWSESCDTGPKKQDESWTTWPDWLSGRNTSYSAVDVVPVPGSGTIKLRGYTESSVTFDGYYFRLLAPNYDYKGRVAVYYYWQVDIVVSSTEKEGLRCGFQNQKGLKFKNHEEKGIPQNESKSDAFIKTLHEELDKMLEGKGSICQAINDSLNSTGRFQHPACGEFNFMDPMFNNRGDILTAARYKAPKKGNKLHKFSMPERGSEVEQGDARKPTDLVKAIGDVTAPIGKKEEKK